jgi:hypothetical protein
MQIATGGGDVAVAQRLLDLRKRCAAIDGVRTMGVAQPVRGNRPVDASLGCGALHHAIDGAFVISSPFIGVEPTSWKDTAPSNRCF